MKLSRKLAAALAASLALSASFPALAAPFAPVATTTTAIVVQQSQPQAIHWESPDGGEAQAMGVGAAPANAGNRAVPMARRAAIADAYRNLAETVQGVNVDSDTTVQDMLVASDTIRTKVNALVKGAKIISEGQNSDGSYFVVMSVPLFGVSGLATATLAESPRSAETDLFANLAAPPVPAATPAPVPAAPPRVAPASGAAYTGVIIDCAGLGLEPAMSPAIYDTNGRGIYGTANIDSRFAVAHGMVQYSKDAQQAAFNSRAGQNPLIIKASGVKGNVKKIHAVVSPEQGDIILAENAKSGMLNSCAVVFVR